jgi:hypothetical protein
LARGRLDQLDLALVKRTRMAARALFSLVDLMLGSRRGGRVLRRLDDTRRAVGKLASARRFTLLVDESGQCAVRQPPKGHFVWGGCVVADRDLPWIESWWRRRQRLFTDDAAAEVKAKHIFTASAPATDRVQAWLLRPTAKVLLSHFLSMGAIPLVASVDKSIAGTSVLRADATGKQRVDRTGMLVLLMTVYSEWLKRRGGTGRIVMDRLSSASEEAEVQAQWTSLRRSTGPASLALIDDRIEFADSALHDGVQIADLVVGCFSEALQRDPNFSNTWGSQVKEASEIGLGLWLLR